MRRRIRAVSVGMSAAVVMALTAAQPSAADVQITTPAYERDAKIFSLHYVRACPTCTSTWYPPGYQVATAYGDAKITVQTFRRADENPDSEVFFVDVTVTVDQNTNHGDEDWGWMDVTVKSIGGVYSIDNDWAVTDGVDQVEQDTKTAHPIDVAIGWGPFSVGTTVAYWTTESKGASITRTSITRGQQYRINKINGTYKATFARFMRVKQGDFPRFSVEVSTNRDGNNDGTVTCGAWDSEQHCWVPRGFTEKYVEIGTAN